MGGTLLMGRKTYDSIGRPLPGRETWVLTRNRNWNVKGVRTIHDGDEVLAAAQQRDIYVVGGGEIYQQWLPRCEQLWWTRVWASIPGDTQVELPLDEFGILCQLRVPISEKDEYPTDWFQLIRRRDTSCFSNAPLDHRSRLSDP